MKAKDHFTFTLYKLKSKLRVPFRVTLEKTKFKINEKEYNYDEV